MNSGKISDETDRGLCPVDIRTKTDENETAVAPVASTRPMSRERKRKRRLLSVSAPLKLPYIKDRPKN